MAPPLRRRLQPRRQVRPGPRRPSQQQVKATSSAGRPHDTADPARSRARRRSASSIFFTRDFVGTYIVPPTETFEHQLVIDDRDVPVHMIFLGRANTDGDAVAWLPQQMIVTSGDIVVSPYPVRLRQLSRRVDTRPWPSRPCLGFTTLIPGHGEPMHDTSYLDRLIASIRDLQAQVGPLAKTGISLDEIRKKVDFSKSITLFGDSPRVKANLQGLFFDPMIGTLTRKPGGSRSSRVTSTAFRHRN